MPMVLMIGQAQTFAIENSIRRPNLWNQSVMVWEDAQEISGCIEHHAVVCGNSHIDFALVTCHSSRDLGMLKVLTSIVGSRKKQTKSKDVKRVVAKLSHAVSLNLVFLCRM